MFLVSFKISFFQNNSEILFILTFLMCNNLFHTENKNWIIQFGYDIKEEEKNGKNLLYLQNDFLRLRLLKHTFEMFQRLFAPKHLGPPFFNIVSFSNTFN